MSAPDSTPVPAAATPVDPAALPADIEDALSAAVGHPATSIGAVSLAGATDGGPTQIIAGTYTDDDGVAHFFLAELKPPDYQVGTVVVDVPIPQFPPTD
jgi:hypothetical protein